MRLHINPLTSNEFGAYRCVAKNSLGDTDGTIKLYSKNNSSPTKNRFFYNYTILRQAFSRLF